MRKMASIRTIKEIRPIAGADKIELAIIDGWQVVVNKGAHQVNEQVVYLEIDSWVPTEIAPFLTKGAKQPREFEGVQGERLKTIKLRGEVSQGLVLPLSVIPREQMDYINAETKYADLPGVDTEVFSSIDGYDVTTILGVKKWEKAMSAQMRGNARRYFPNFIQKTDQERIQNMLRTLENRFAKNRNEVYEVTLKRDGSSTSFYVYPNEEGVVETGVCSRNLELKTDESNAENLFVQMYNKLGIPERLKAFNAQYNRNIALQGELWGTGINGNWEGVDGVFFNLFDVFDCDNYRYVDAPTRYDVVKFLNRRDDFPMIEHVPVIDTGTLEDLGVVSYDDEGKPELKIENFLKYADRPSTHNSIAEGVVFKSLSDPQFSFKAINNKYLLEGGE